MTIIKLPAAYDVAGSYQRIADWGKVNPRPLFVAHKATEGNFYQDPYFKIDFAGMLANGIKRGAYHFFRKAVNSLTQAQYFCNYVRGTLTNNDYIVLDMEEGGETIAQIFAWLDGVEDQYINDIIIYSNKSKIDALATQCTPAELTRLRNYKIWIAGYPFNPDLYPEIPASYIPAGFTVCMWQYSSTGRVTGILTPSGVQGNVDLDWLSPAFIAELGGQTPPPNGEPMAYGKAQEIKNNVPSVRLAPDVSGQKVGSLTAGVIVDFMELVPGSLKPADRWLKLTNGIHYVNQNVGGVELFRILSMPTTEPPPPSATVPAVIEMNLSAGSTVTIKDSTGTVIWTGTAQ